MESKPIALMLSISAASLLTWGLSLSVVSRSASAKPLIELFVVIVGIAGNITVWLANYLRGNEVWAVSGWVDYVVYFLGNLGLFIAVLWGEMDSPAERHLLFTLRLPFFILLVPLFWSAVLLAVVVNPFRMLGDSLRTPVRMWCGLLNWLLGSPPGYRLPE